MFTTKPEAGDKITKLSGGSGDAKTPFTERPATYASKSPGPSASKMVPSIIGEDLTIIGNVICKGEIQVDGVYRGRHPLRVAFARRQVAGDGQCCGRRCSGTRPSGRIDHGLRLTLRVMPCGRRHPVPEPCARAGCPF